MDDEAKQILRDIRDTLLRNEERVKRNIARTNKFLAFFALVSIISMGMSATVFLGLPSSPRPAPSVDGP